MILHPVLYSDFSLVLYARQGKTQRVNILFELTPFIIFLLKSNSDVS